MQKHESTLLHMYDCMYWTIFWQLTIHVQQDIFEKTLIEVGSSHLYASSGTFCVQIGQLFEALYAIVHISEDMLIPWYECD